jgi:hypothetical protein
LFIYAILFPTAVAPSAKNQGNRDTDFCLMFTVFSLLKWWVCTYNMKEMKSWEYDIMSSKNAFNEILISKTDDTFSIAY